MDIHTATQSYEHWLAGVLPSPFDSADLDRKHQLMNDPANPFPFFRGTYYRWIQRWAEAPESLTLAPSVLSIGDIHIENYGTWRDAEGRLCWGVNDFDEVDDLPYTHDLVRLAASVRMARKAEGMAAKFDAGCEAILDGYRNGLKSGGRPFVLEEHHSHLRAIALSAEREPVRFWDKMTKYPEAEPPEEVRVALEKALPVRGLTVNYHARREAGVGSLGRPRYIALAVWADAWTCREAKASAPPASAWAAGSNSPNRASEAVSRAVRSHDPYYLPGPRWIIRRLGPHSSRIELSPLEVTDAVRMLRAMGAEIANVHLGSKGAAAKIQADLATRPIGWLADAARIMAKMMEQDWVDWRSRS